MMRPIAVPSTPAPPPLPASRRTTDVAGVPRMPGREVDSRTGMKKPIATTGATVLTFLTLASAAGLGQAQRGATPPRAPAVQAASGYTRPRTPHRKPDLNGIWQ